MARRGKLVTCTTCKEKTEDKPFCDHCGAMMYGDDILSKEDGSVLLSEVKSSEQERIKTGFCALWTGSGSQSAPRMFEQNGFGAGLPLRSVTMLAGGPGNGKSTMLLGLCDNVLSEIEGEALYIAAEEALEDIKERAVRLELKHMARIRMVSAMTGEADLPLVIRTHRPKLVILDSLQGFQGDDMTGMAPLCHDLKVVANELTAPIIIVCQVTKDDDFAGPKTVQHAVDVLVGLTISDGDVREWYVIKNRYGRAAVTAYLLMTAKGLELLPDYDEEGLDEEDEEGYSDE